MNVIDPPPATGSREQATAQAEVGAAAASTPGALYATYGAVTAGAAAAAVADKNPRRKAYMRHVILMATLVVLVGALLIVTINVLFGS